MPDAHVHQPSLSRTPMKTKNSKHKPASQNTARKYNELLKHGSFLARNPARQSSSKMQVKSEQRQRSPTYVPYTQAKIRRDQSLTHGSSPTKIRERIVFKNDNAKLSGDSSCVFRIPLSIRQRRLRPLSLRRRVRSHSWSGRCSRRRGCGMVVRFAGVETCKSAAGAH